MKLSSGVPTYDEVMLPLLRAAASGPVSLAEATERVSDLMGLSAEQRSALMPKGRAYIRDRVGWARTYLGHAGLLRPVQRGVFETSDRGRAWLERGLAKISIEMLLELPEFREFRERSSARSAREDDASGAFNPADDSYAATPEERIDAGINELDVALREALLARVRAVAPRFFEQLVIELLVGMGYGGSREDAARHLGGPRDGGVDGVIKLDKLGLDVVYIQAKRNSADNAISRPVVQAFAGALDTQGATRGVFITTSSFTPDARDCAAAIRTKQIVLIDGVELADLLIHHDVGVREDRRITIKKIDEDFFEE